MTARPPKRFLLVQLRESAPFHLSMQSPHQGCQDKDHAMSATAQSAIAVSGIDIGWPRVPPLSQGQPNVFLAQKDLSEPLMIIEPEISL
jgi:hypothetical protein